MRERVGHGEADRQEFGRGAGRWVRRWSDGRPAPGPRPVRPPGATAAVRPPEVPRPVRGTATGNVVEHVEADGTAGYGGAAGIGAAGIGAAGIGAAGIGAAGYGAVGYGAAGRGGAWGDGAGRSGPRLLVRAGAGRCTRAGGGSRLRRVVAGLAVAAATAAVVVALGLLARVAGPSPVEQAGPAVGAPVVGASAVGAPVVVVAEPGETVWEVAGRVAPGRPGAEVAAVAERIVADNALRSVRLEPGQVLRVAGG